MATLLSAHRLSKSFGARNLFTSISFGLAEGDRVGLIGPNGAGKSTLLKCLAGLETPDAGDLIFGRGVRIGFLQQTPEFAPNVTIYDALLSAGDSHDPVHLAGVDEWISRLDLNSDGRAPDSVVSSLSGGWQKRVALARELVKLPDILLLDEPTNHLDVEGILWLEEFLANSSMALLMITHDRLFLERTVNRVIELDARYTEGVLDIRGSYSNFLEARALQLASQVRQEEAMRNTLRRETEWLRRGAKARQTKQKARIERAGELRDATSEMIDRNLERRSRIEFQDNERRPQKLIEAKKISAVRGGRVLFEELDLIVTPKTRLGLLGPNGCGKSTLIRTLLGIEPPDHGQVLPAEKLKAGWFEQDKKSLDHNLTVLRAVCPEGDYVMLDGKPLVARAYLHRFLFRPEQLDMPLSRLSGGEKSRLRVAQMMLEPANILVLDEPTNDLDTATLDVLAQSIEEFNGAVILVTHDRYFLDQVTDDILAFPSDVQSTDQQLQRFAGYSQWEMWFDESRDTQKRASSKDAKNSPEASHGAMPGPKRKISFKEKHDWETIEARILEKESALAALEAKANDPELGSDLDRARDLFQQIADQQNQIAQLYERWAELDAIMKA
jgi:ATP-binding cassette subfamily F protein uup